MKRIYIKDIVYDTEIKIAGFIEKIREPKNMVFLVLKDKTGSIQVTINKEENPALAEKLQGIIAQSVITVVGKAVESPYVKMGGREFLPTEIVVESVAEPLPITPDAHIDLRLNYRWIDIRSERNALIFKAQTSFTTGMREFLAANDFTEIHSPKLIAAASESGSDVFEVKYFDRKAYLAQSPQFYKQMAMAGGLERIFECGPVFRAEQSFTNRHATEFTGFDLEMSYIDSYEDILDLEEDLLIAGLKRVKAEYGEEIKRVFDCEVIVPTRPFPRIALADLYEELKKYGLSVHESEMNDLTTEAEQLSYKFSMEKFNHEFLFVTNYPAAKRAFYHMRKNGVLQGYDLLWKGIEITTGAQREHRYEELKKQAQEKGLAEDVAFYLEFFKYGCPPHGGFGLGLDRITMLLLNIPSIKEIMFLFRGPNRLTP